MEMSGALTKVLPRQVLGKYGVCFIYAERAVNEKIADCGGKTALVLPTSSPRRVGLLAGICWIKSQVPAKSPPGLGGRGYKPTT